jgi:hypothetical protein
VCRWHREQSGLERVRSGSIDLFRRRYDWICWRIRLPLATLLVAPIYDAIRSAWWTTNHYITARGIAYGTVVGTGPFFRLRPPVGPRACSHRLCERFGARRIACAKIVLGCVWAYSGLATLSNRCGVKCRCGHCQSADYGQSQNLLDVHEAPPCWPELQRKQVRCVDDPAPPPHCQCIARRGAPLARVRR